MFTVDIDMCMAIPVKTAYIAIGGGKNMGEFLLREYAQAVPDFEFGDVIAAAVVENYTGRERVWHEQDEVGQDEVGCRRSPLLKT